jgi:elongator complex protein 3
MADLPGATPEIDKACYKAILQDDPDLIPDYMKDYPCLDVDFTEIKKWKASGKWKPYAEADGGRLLKDVLIYRQQITPKWVRVNRIQRDFRPACSGSRLGFTSDSLTTNLGNEVTKLAEDAGIYCQCIRCCEVRNQKYDVANIQYNIYPLIASGAQEYFIAAEVPRPNRNLLLGFIRLRLCHWTSVPEIEALAEGQTAMIRELHVYGQVNKVGSKDQKGAQHRGIGKQLLKIAEKMAVGASYDQMAIIAGVGVRDYYRKFGYELRDTYMIKVLDSSCIYNTITMCITVGFVIMVLLVLFNHQ